MTFFLLFGLLVIGVAIYAGNRRPTNPRGGSRGGSRDDDGYSFSQSSRSIFEDSGGAACGDGDRDGDGIPDSIDQDDGGFGGGDSDCSSDSGGDSGSSDSGSSSD